MSTSIRRITALVAAAAVVLIASWYLALWHPESTKLTAANKARAAAEAHVAQLRGQVATLTALERQIPADKVKLATLDAAVPSTPDLAGVLTQLQQVANATGTSLSDVTPGAATTPSSGAPKVSGPPSITLTMSATGDYAQLAGFLRGLDTMPRTVVVDHLNISGTTTTLTASIGARIFSSGRPTP